MPAKCTTTVVHCKQAPFDVYIGRSMGSGERDLGWGNPFVIGRDGSRKECIDKYREWILKQPELLARIKVELQGRVLGCWCAPNACHGDVLASLADSVKVAVVGSREYPRPDLVRRFVALMTLSTTLVSGGAKGVDSWAAEAAQSRGMPTEVYFADWDNHGKRAGFLRNETLVAVADYVVAFWDGKSRGTRHTINLSITQNKLFRVYMADGSSLGARQFIEKYGEPII
jgi:hypothetical protein